MKSRFAAAKLNAALVIDATQAAGVLDLDVARIQPDFMTASGYKWLLCPYTTGFLYVHPRHHAGRPLEQYSWHLNDPPRGGVRRGDDMDEGFGARRFDMGERSNPINFAMTVPALQQLVDWTPARLRSHTRPMIEAVADGALARGFSLPSPAQRSPHLIGLRYAPGMPEDLEAQFLARDVCIARRGDALRVSP